MKAHPQAGPPPPAPAAVRYAVYFAPPEESDWWQFGCRWLGRDPISGAERAQPVLPGISSSHMRELTDDARRYGFHATLKPPFALTAESVPADFHDAVAALARTQTAFSLGRLEADLLGSFIALRPGIFNPQLQDLARACVEALDAFRVRPDAHELARRRGANLSARQDALLDRWGYPYVLDEWRFHMTLTRSLPRGEAAALLHWLRSRVERLNTAPMVVDALCVFEEPARGAPFRLTHRLAFDGNVVDYTQRGLSLSAPG